MNYYQILGLTPQATQNEIKRAYFKLLREHSPEKDPEGFRQIREAYEYLKSAPVKEDGPSFPPFKEPIEQRFADQVESAFKTRNYRLARDTAKEAWKYFPDDLFFLYWLVKAQRACGNTGNSVKNAEILVKKAPDNKWFRREYGVSLMERGFINKAYDPLCKAYEMGIRDLDFILLFANECMQFGQSQKAAEILLEVVRRDKKWLKDDMVYMQAVYEGLSMTYFETGENGEEIFLRLCSFIREYKLLIREQSDDWLDTLHSLISFIDFEIDREKYSVLTETMALLSSVLNDPDSRKSTTDLLWETLIYSLKEDPRICPSLEYKSELEFFPPTDDPTLNKYADMDCSLCMIAEREKIIAVEDVLRSDYLEFYEKIKDLIAILRDEQSALSYKAKLLPRYAKASEEITGGRYFKLYPEEKAKVYGTIIASGDSPYERPHKKIGRNDPCPCGSGKKYKKCCMGKI